MTLCQCLFLYKPYTIILYILYLERYTLGGDWIGVYVDVGKERGWWSGEFIYHIL